MKRESRTIWLSDQGRELVVQEGKQFRVVPAGCDLVTLRELRDAINDVLEQNNKPEPGDQ